MYSTKNKLVNTNPNIKYPLSLYTSKKVVEVVEVVESRMVTGFWTNHLAEKGGWQVVVSATPTTSNPHGITNSHFMRVSIP